MNIKEIDGTTFNTFAKTHILKNFYQTLEYGNLMNYSDFKVMYIGGYKNNTLLAASLILYKSIGPNMKYGYAPRGFLINYYDTELLKTFTKKIKDFFLFRGFAFIKINPEVTYSVIDYENKSKKVNSRNEKLIQELKLFGYDKLKDNLYFESVLPKYTPVIYLSDFNINSLDNDVVKDIHDCELKGLTIKEGTIDDISTLYNFVSEKDSKPEVYYKHLYEEFNKSGKIDLLFLELNYEQYLKYLQKQFIYEQDQNEKINIEFNNNTDNIDLYNRKIKSDKKLNDINVDISKSNQRIKSEKFSEILGSILIIKHEGRASIVISGQSNDFISTDIKTYFYYKVIEKYKKEGLLFFDMNGITADFSEKNPYKKLNDFKLKFNPTTYEYIGEFDLIINKPFHQLLWSTNQIQKEFYKPTIKK